MARSVSRIGAGLATAALLSLVATPAFAQGWGGWGGGHHHHHHGGGSDAGAIIAGLLVIGGIAAIASSSSKHDRERYSYPENRDPGNGYPDDGYRGEAYPNGNYPNEPYQGDDGDTSSHYGEVPDQSYAPSGNGMNGAVEACTAAVERNETQVDSVDSVNREGDGWRIEGRTAANQEFGCSVSNGGSVRSVTVDGDTVGGDAQ